MLGGERGGRRTWAKDFNAACFGQSQIGCVCSWWDLKKYEKRAAIESGLEKQDVLGMRDFVIARNYVTNFS